MSKFDEIKARGIQKYNESREQREAQEVKNAEIRQKRFEEAVNKAVSVIEAIFPAKLEETFSFNGEHTKSVTVRDLPISDLDIVREAFRRSSYADNITDVAEAKSLNRLSGGKDYIVTLK